VLLEISMRRSYFFSCVFIEEDYSHFDELPSVVCRVMLCGQNVSKEVIYYSLHYGVECSLDKRKLVTTYVLFSTHRSDQKIILTVKLTILFVLD
jgi:hypothetical protein